MTGCAALECMVGSASATVAPEDAICRVGL